MDPVARGTLINFSTRVLSVAALLGLTTLSARMGTEVQGAFALFTSAEGVLIALLSGFGVALARQASQGGARQAAPLAGATVLACLLAGWAAGLLLAGLAWFGPAAYGMFLWLALAAPLLLLGPSLAGLWLGAGRMAPLAAQTLLPPLLALAGLGLAALGWPEQVGLGLLLAIWLLAKVLVSLGVVGVLWHGEGLARPDLPRLRAELPFVLTIGLTNLVGLLNYRAGLLLVERQLGLDRAGVYSIGIVVAELLWFVSSSLTQAVYGRIGTPDGERAAQLTVRTAQLSWVALLVCMLPLGLLATALVPRVLGPAYADSLAVMAWMLPGVLLFGGASSLSAYFTNHAGRPQVAARVAGLSLGLNVLLSLVLIPGLGMRGAALATSLSYALGVVYLGGLFARHAGLPLSALWWPGASLRQDLRTVAGLLGRWLHWRKAS